VNSKLCTSVIAMYSLQFRIDSKVLPVVLKCVNKVSINPSQNPLYKSRVNSYTDNSQTVSR
jgi:hypothetical protein